MFAWGVKRFMSALLTIFVAIVILFLATYMSSVNPARALVGPRATKDTVEAMRHELGLDKNIFTQFWIYLKRLASGKLGRSYVTRRPVFQLIKKRLPPSLLLSLASILILAILGVFFGAVMAVNPNTWLDRVMNITALTLLSFPQFWLGFILIYVFSYKFDLLPATGYGSFSHLILPVLAVTLPWIGWYARITRSSLLEVANMDYVRTGRSKGLSEWKVINKYMLRNAIIPVTTMLVLDAARFVGILVVIEKVFSWPGIGSLIVKAAWTNDRMVLLGTIVVMVILLKTSTFLLELIYPVLDPRIRYD